MRKGYSIETVTSVDTQGIAEIGGIVTDLCEGVMYREKFKISPFREAGDKLFA